MTVDERSGVSFCSRCCRFAAVGPAGRRYRSIAAAAAGECGQCHHCRINVDAIDAAALGPFKKKKSLLCFGCDFSVWYNMWRIISTIVATRDVIF